MAAHSQDVLNPFLAEVLETQGGRLVQQCYQCGTCSGSCPVIDDMAYGPRRIMHMIQAGMEAEVLSSKDMWRCVSCYSCANRCPREIEITDLMADLRRMSVAKGYAHDKEAEFGEAFAQTVQVHGRLFEPELLTRYYARVLDVASLAGMVPLGLKMLLKGKLPFVPERVEDPGEIAAIGVVASTQPKFASGLRGGRPSSPARHSSYYASEAGGEKSGESWRLLGGVLGGALVTLLAGLLLGAGGRVRPERSLRTRPERSRSRGRT